MRILFVEPPKDFWFLMGEYMPPPLGILQLAAYVEDKCQNVEIEVLDCQAKDLDWRGLEKRMESFDPDIVASSGLATCNAYITARTLETAKTVKPDVLTLAGGQHFTATAQESLEAYPEIDVIVRGEGERTLVELLEVSAQKVSLSRVKGISYRAKGKIWHNPPRPLIENLDKLPYPAYHFVEDVVHKYHFTMMGSRSEYAIIEGSRGCQHRCTFCSQWRYWEGAWRVKSAKRIADEMEFCFQNYGSKTLWLTDDDFSFGKRGRDLCNEIIRRGFSDDIMWWVQARCDDVVKYQSLLPTMRKAGNYWMLLGAESNSSSILNSFNKKTDPGDAKKAVKILKKNDIFSQAMLIIGERGDTAESIAALREFANDLDPDLAIFVVLTPLPGTQIYETARRNGWIEDTNWANYDMIHAVMPTETLSREELQEELYRCYRSFYGSMSRRLKGIFSSNKLKRRCYRYLAGQGIMNQLRSLF